MEKIMYVQKIIKDVLVIGVKTNFKIKGGTCVYVNAFYIRSDVNLESIPELSNLVKRYDKEKYKEDIIYFQFVNQNKNLIYSFQLPLRKLVNPPYSGMKDACLEIYEAKIKAFGL